eukprot:4431212-Pleurochrysis_carterae.AAC.1
MAVEAGPTAVLVAPLIDDVRRAGDDVGAVAAILTELYKGCKYLGECMSGTGEKKGKAALVSYRVVTSPVRAASV